MGLFIASKTCVTVLPFLLLCMTAVSLAVVVTIEPKVKNLLVPVGSKQALDCHIPVGDEDDPKNLSWSLPSGAGTEYTINTRTDDGHTYHSVLTIESFTTNFEGTYTCRYKVNGGQDEADIQLIAVTEIKTEFDFYHTNKSAVLECFLEFSSSSYNATLDKWLLSNVSVSDLKPEKYEDFENGTLLFTKPNRADGGVYTARYKVEYKSESGSNIKMTHDCNVTFKAGPLVMDMKKSENIIEGETLKLECLVKGYPRAEVTWLKDNQILNNSRSSLEVLPKADLLIIESTTRGDSGVYNCVAVDPDSRRSTKSIVVRVKDSLEWLWPVIAILCEIILLTIIILVRNKIKKSEEVEKPADEREGLLRQGSGRHRDHDKHA